LADRLDPQARSRLMRAVKSKDTTPERAVRSLLHRMGYRFRLHRKDLAGTPDIVLPRFGAAIFVHGCFWHGHGCKIGRLPRSKLDYWQPKIGANRERDERKAQTLRGQGWRVLAVWQCELKDEAALAARLRRFVEG
jgi:DNA mismatch endonuclease (patch repair protein)